MKEQMLLTISSEWYVYHHIQNHIQWDSDYFRTSKGNKTWFENQLVQEIGGKITVQCLTGEWEMTFGSSYQEVWKNEDSRNWDSTVLKS